MSSFEPDASHHGRDTGQVSGVSVTMRPDTFHRRTVAFWDTINALDLCLGVLLVFASFQLTPSLPGRIILSALIAAVGVCRRPTYHVSWGGVMLIGTFLLYGYLVLVSIYEGTNWHQRIAKFVLLLLLAAIVAAGRIDIRSLVIGGCIGAVLNVPLFYAGLTSDHYPPYLTGLYGDKNVAGMYYALWGVLGLMVMGKRWRVPWVLLSTVFLILTGSRTSIAAFCLAVSWYVLRNRVGPGVRLALAACGAVSLRVVENHFSQVGIYADRLGDDWFRRQIDLATFAKEAITPWRGLGLNEGFVVLGGRRTEWFHDSYAQAFVEGGYPFLWATIVAFVVVGLGIFSMRRTVSAELLAAEAAIVVILVCAWKLGETFMTLGAFLPLGIAVALRLGERTAREDGELPGGPT